LAPAARRAGSSACPYNSIATKTYFTKFYADTALFGAPHGVRWGLEYSPIERVLFGSDTPFDAVGGIRYIRETIADLDAVGLAPEQRRMVDEGKTYDESSRGAMNDVSDSPQS
jgi:hypothetical protein